MANQKITDLTAATVKAPADLLEVVTDVSTTPTNKKIALSSLFASPVSGGIPYLENVKTVGGFFGSIATGDNDLYTVPAGKRAMFITSCYMYNNSGVGNIVATLNAKVGGTYYRISSSKTVSNAAASTSDWLAGAVCLEAGDSLSVNTTTNNGLNLWVSLLEFDATSGVKNGRVLGLATGHNTMFTLASGKTGGAFPSLSGTSSASRVIISNDSGGTRTYSINYVPNGGSAGDTNKITANATVNNLTTSNTSLLAPVAFSALDSLSINIDTGHASTSAWATYIEF